MSRRWRREKYTKEVVLSPQEVARRSEEASRRKLQAAEANLAIAEVHLPRLRAELSKHVADIEAFTRSRGLSAAEAPLLREQLATTMAASRKAEQEIQRAKTRIEDARKAIESISGADKRAQGFLHCTLFGYTPSGQATAQVDRQRQAIQDADRDLHELQNAIQKLSEEELHFISAFDSVLRVQNSIAYHESAAKRLVRLKEATARAKEAEQKKREKEGLKEGIVAAFLDRTRDLADDIKKQLIYQAVQCPSCPYCGNDYGVAPHADHIYPVSRGGLSTLDNMVLVCETCNLKKSDKTLREFTLENLMDRSIIEMNLERLGKTF